MIAKRMMLAGLLVPLMLTGCFMHGRHRAEVVVVPSLPQVVVLEAEPYYVQDGYHYHYLNNAWYYGRSRSGPWTPLPKGHYPKEVRFKSDGPERDGGRTPRRQGK